MPGPWPGIDWRRATEIWQEGEFGPTKVRPTGKPASIATAFFANPPNLPPIRARRPCARHDPRDPRSRAIPCALCPARFRCTISSVTNVDSAVLDGDGCYPDRGFDVFAKSGGGETCFALDLQRKVIRIRRSWHAPKCGLSRKAVPFSGGRNLIDILTTYSTLKGTIDRVDIFSHGSDCGVIGATAGDVGFYVDDPGCHLSVVAATVSDFARAVKDGKIRIPKQGEISFWGCNTFRVAESLYNVLKAQGTPVNTVIGACGGTWPIHNKRGMETGIFAARFFHRSVRSQEKETVVERSQILTALRSSGRTLSHPKASG